MNVANNTIAGAQELPTRHDITNPHDPEINENRRDNTKYCFILFEIFLAAAAGNVNRELINNIPTHLIARDTTTAINIMNDNL